MCALLWLTLTLSTPADVCALPPVGWTLEDLSDGWGRWAGRTDDLQPAFDKCISSGGQVMSSEETKQLLCYGTSYGFQRPCMSDAKVIIEYRGMYAPGAPRFGCKDIVVELVPEDEAEWSVPFFDGSLNFKGPRI